MINPAQYTQVLQQASDPQLMSMLKRPDKIPSQFVVAEINRRQSMRQAAMADRQRQAGVQEMMTAQGATPQQPQQPMEMREGGMVANAQQLSEISNQLSSLVDGGGSSGGISNLLSMNNSGPNSAFQPAYQRVPFAAQLFGGFGPRPNSFAPQSTLRGMSIGGGGPNMFTAMGLNTNPPAPERYGIPPFDPNRETLTEYNFRVNQARRNKIAMERIAMADAGMETDVNIQRPEETSSSDGGVKEPFLRVGNVNPQNVFSDGSPADILTALQGSGETVSGPQERGQRADNKKRPSEENNNPPFLRVGNVNPQNAFSDGTPSDIPRALGAGVASLYNQVFDSDFAGRYLKGKQFGGEDKSPLRMIQGQYFDKKENIAAANAMPLDPIVKGEQERRYQASVDAADRDAQAQQAASLGLRSQVVTPANARSVSNVASQNPGDTLPQDAPSNAENSIPESSNYSTIKKATDAAYAAFLGDRQAVDALSPKTSNASPSDAGGGITSISPPEPITNVSTTSTPAVNDTTKSSGSVPSGSGENDNTDADTTGGKTKQGSSPSENMFMPGANTKNYTTLAEAFNQEQEDNNTEIDRLRVQVRDADKERLDVLQTDLNSLLEAQKDLAGVYDKTSTKPENRIFRSMIDAGLALAGSKEANFLQAVAQSGQTGLQTFDRLNDEAKQNLKDKYGAAVDIARAKVDVTNQINTLARGIDTTDIDIATNQANNAKAAFDRTVKGQEMDINAALAFGAADRDDKRVSIAQGGLKLQGDELALKNQIFEFNKDKDAFGRTIQERAATVNELVANTTLWKAVRGAENDDKRLDILASQLDLDRDKLDFTVASTAIDQQLKALGLDKPADSVAKLEWMKSQFGDDGLKEILLGREKAATGVVKDDDVLAAATDLYKADPYAPIPGNGSPSQEEALAYYEGVIRNVFKGGGGGQSAAGPADDTLDFGD